MRKSIFHVLFGLGKILRRNREKLESEGIVLLEEGMPASMTFYHFRGMGRISSYRIVGFAAALVLTKSRIYANGYLREIIDVPLTDEHMRRLELSIDQKGRLVIFFDAADFMPATGRIRLRFRAEQARAFYDALLPHVTPTETGAKPQ